MILVTVGSAPHDFSRLIRAVDQIAPRLEKEVVIQVGFSRYRPQHSRWFDFVSYEEMLRYFERASVIVSHTSAGPILHAKRLGKSLLLFPRSGDLDEHVDNHQIEVARALEQAEPGAFEVAYEVSQLEGALRRALSKSSEMAEGKKEGPREVVDRIRDYVDSLETPPSFYRRLKQAFFRLRIYQFLSDLRNNTFWLLRQGYNPPEFWKGWSRTFFRQKFRHAIGGSHRWLLDEIQRKGGGRILEAGCCFGRTLKFLAAQGDSRGEVVGVDFSLDMLRYGRSYLGPPLNRRLVCGEVTRLPFPDHSFDLVFTHGTLMHLPEEALRPALAELERVSRGSLCLIEEAYWNRHPPPKSVVRPNPYTFLHNYLPVLAELGWEIRETRFVEEGAMVLICLACEKQSVRVPL